MESGDVRWALQLSLGLAAGIGTVSLATGEPPGVGVLLGLALVLVLVLALSSTDGPLEERTARIGAVVVSAGLVGAALLLMN